MRTDELQYDTIKLPPRRIYLLPWGGDRFTSSFFLPVERANCNQGAKWGRIVHFSLVPYCNLTDVSNPFLNKLIKENTLCYIQQLPMQEFPRRVRPSPIRQLRLRGAGRTPNVETYPR